MFLKECKKIMHSLVFWVFVVVMAAAYLTQFAPELEQRMAEPAKGQESYGTMVVERPDILMPAAVQSLIGEYLQDYYTAWPMGFYKEIHLKEEERVKMAAIIEELSGLTKEELDSFTEYEPGGYGERMDENGNLVSTRQEAVLPEYTLSEKVSYERFKELMQEADELLGGGSKYGEGDLLRNFSQIPMSYEDALAEYQINVTKEALGGVYGRLYCDYMGIFLAVMPVFAAAAFWDMDRRAKAGALIYSRKASSVKIVGMRFAALLCCMMLPLLFTFPHTVFRLNGLYREIGIEWGKAVFLVILWLLPSLLFVTAFSILLTELASPLLAVLIQGLWWFLSLQTNQVSGSVTKWTLLIRHNMLGGSALFQSEWGDFLWNRTCYFILAIVCVGIETLVFERIRRGCRRGE